MILETEPEPTDEAAPTVHLRRALECPETEHKNFHIRQALQLLVAESETP